MPRPDPRVITSLFFAPFLSFPSVVTETHPSHLKATVSALSQLISLAHSACPSAFPIPRIPASILLPSPLPNTVTSNTNATTSAPTPPPQAQPPLQYSQSHLQSDIFNGLITLSSHGLMEHLTSAPHPARPPALPLHLYPLTAPKCFLLIFPPCLGLLLPPFSHLASAKALPWTPDPTLTSRLAERPRRSSPSFSQQRRSANWTSIGRMLSMISPQCRDCAN